MSAFFLFRLLYAVLVIFSLEIKDGLCKNMVEGQSSVEANNIYDPDEGNENSIFTIEGKCYKPVECDLKQCSFEFQSGACLKCSCKYPTKEAACAALKCSSREYCKILNKYECKRGSCRAECHTIDADACEEIKPCKWNEKCTVVSSKIVCEYIGPPENCVQLKKHEPCPEGSGTYCVENDGLAECKAPQNCHELENEIGKCEDGYQCKMTRNGPKCQKEKDPCATGKPCKWNEKCTVVNSEIICVYVGPPENCEQLKKHEPCPEGSGTYCVEDDGTAECKAPQNCHEFEKEIGKCQNGYHCKMTRNGPKCEKRSPETCEELEKEIGKCENGYQCEVTSNGPKCEEKKDPCATKSCGNEQCKVNDDGTAECIANDPCDEKCSEDQYCHVTSETQANCKWKETSRCAKRDCNADKHDCKMVGNNAVCTRKPRKKTDGKNKQR